MSSTNRESLNSVTMRPGQRVMDFANHVKVLGSKANCQDQTTLAQIFFRNLGEHIHRAAKTSIPPQGWATLEDAVAYAVEAERNSEHIVSAAAAHQKHVSDQATLKLQGTKKRVVAAVSGQPPAKKWLVQLETTKAKTFQKPVLRSPSTTKG